MIAPLPIALAFIGLIVSAHTKLTFTAAGATVAMPVLWLIAAIVALTAAALVLWIIRGILCDGGLRLRPAAA